MQSGVERASRPGLILSAALLTEVVVVAAVDNQGVGGGLANYVGDPHRSFYDYSAGALHAATTFLWRFAPAAGQSTHAWAAQLAAIGALLLLTALGTLAVARGAATFTRVWVAVWGVVAAVTPLAIMVRNVIVIPSAPGPNQSRAGQAVYAYPDFGPVIVAGLVLGLLTGLVAAVVAVRTRRTPEQQPEAAETVPDPAAQYEPYADPYSPARYPVRYDDSPYPPQPAPWGSDDTAQLRPLRTDYEPETEQR